MIHTLWLASARGWTSRAMLLNVAAAARRRLRRLQRCRPTLHRPQTRWLECVLYLRTRPVMNSPRQRQLMV
ncbi:hypothetical protein EON67_04450 [archaeon]|nr:MAG: hypothetical protein EON67_04450 [archaeon]